MIRRVLFVLLFAVSLGVAGAVGYYVNEYQHLKKDYEDLRIITRSTMMENERNQENSRSCLASLHVIRKELFMPTLDLDFTDSPTPLKFAQGR